MTLIERLREEAAREVIAGNPVRAALMTESADALEAKDARIKELEGALREIANPSDAALVRLGQHLRPYEPIGEENVRELLGDLREGVDDAFGELARKALK